jgi:hypothetical protein
VALVGVALGLAGCTTSDTDVRVGGGVETTVTVDVE